MVAVSAASVAVLSVLVTAAAPAGAGVRARAPAPSAFQAAIQQIVNDGVPGAIGLARHGSRVTVATSGLADIATQTPMASGDRVRVGSVTKTFVATVVLQLVAEHRLALNDTVGRWLPGLVPGGGNITIEELLQHTSGIYSYTNDPGFLRALFSDPTRVWRPAELVRIAVAHPPVFPPGTSFAYSNTDYVLLGLIIQAATGHPAGQELQARIFRPLGLRDTYIPYADPHLRQPHAHGYALGQPGATGPADTTVMSPSWGRRQPGSRPGQRRRAIRPAAKRHPQRRHNRHLRQRLTTDTLPRVAPRQAPSSTRPERSPPLSRPSAGRRARVWVKCGEWTDRPG